MVRGRRLVGLVAVTSIVSFAAYGFDKRRAITGGRHEQRDAELAVIRQICAETQIKEERVKLWQQRTGKSQATFYRRLKEIGTGRNGSE